jgi:hypothetical protein
MLAEMKEGGGYLIVGRFGLGERDRAKAENEEGYGMLDK